jgi:hypothetical protein
MENDLRYWSCEIGPIKIDKLPFGSDGPLRSAVQNKFIEMFGHQAETCSSGWGLTEEMKTRLDIISLLPITDPETLEKIDEILSKRKMD